MSNISQETFDKIRNQVDSSDVVLYMKGTPDFPQCGFSSVVAHILNSLNVPYNSVNVLADHEIREGIKVFGDWPTIPQLYVKGNLIGGCDIVKEMHQSGELEELLKVNNIL